MTEVTQTLPSHGAAAVSLVAAGLLLSPLNVTKVDARIPLATKVVAFAGASASFGRDYDPFSEMTLLPAEQSTLVDLYANLLSHQEDLGEEFARVLFDNAWDLYAR